MKRTQRRENFVDISNGHEMKYPKKITNIILFKQSIKKSNSYLNSNLYYINVYEKIIFSAHFELNFNR